MAPKISTWTLRTPFPGEGVSLVVGELVGVSFVGVPPGVVVVDAPVLVVKFVG